LGTFDTEKQSEIRFSLPYPPLVASCLAQLDGHRGSIIQLTLFDTVN
jgi:hypothetical protein